MASSGHMEPSSSRPEAPSGTKERVPRTREGGTGARKVRCTAAAAPSMAVRARRRAGSLVSHAT